MQTKKIKIKILRPAEYNPRTITKKRLENLKEQLKNDPDFLEVRPLIVNTYRGRENIVIAGNQRLAAAKELGWKTISCLLVAVPLKKEKEWNLKDNKSWGQWEWELLEEHFEQTVLKSAGFTEEELKFQFSLQNSAPPVLPDLESGGVQTKSITVYYAPEIMDAIISKINSYKGSNISDKFRALVERADYGD